MAREITYNNFEISLVVFMPNITTNHAITYTNIFKTPHHIEQNKEKKFLVTSVQVAVLQYIMGNDQSQRM